MYVSFFQLTGSYLEKAEGTSEKAKGALEKMEKIVIQLKDIAKDKSLSRYRLLSK